MGKRGKLPKASLPVAVSSCEPVNKPSKAYMERERRYQAEDGLRALNRAEEIRGDKKLMSDIKSLANEQVENLKRFTK